MQAKHHIKKNDTVVVITGDYKGQQGKVLSVDKKNNRVLVEGINMVSRHTKPNAANPQGGIIKKEASVHISNVALVVDGKATRVGRKLDEKSNKLVRYAKSTGEVIK